jgi:peptidyl-prolyl cis-trans isomerase C
MPDNAYLTLKLASELYHKSPAALAADERRRVNDVATRQNEIERRILATAEAARVVLPPSAVEASVATIRARYDNDELFLLDLAGNGLDEARLRHAVMRDLAVEAVLEGVASRAGSVDATEVEIFYLMHRERFRKPETRSLRHILVTINDTVAGNAREEAKAKIDAVRDRVLGSPERFTQEALQHSECPTAMNGGQLGRLPRGQLYAELEPAAFVLAPGETSAVLESPLGFHIIRCDDVQPARQLDLEEVSGRIRQQLDDARRSKAQKAWIADLFKAA